MPRFWRQKSLGQLLTIGAHSRVAALQSQTASAHRPERPQPATNLIAALCFRARPKSFNDSILPRDLSSSCAFFAHNSTTALSNMTRAIAPRTNVLNQGQYPTAVNRKSFSKTHFVFSFYHNCAKNFLHYRGAVKVSSSDSFRIVLKLEQAPLANRRRKTLVEHSSLAALSVQREAILCDGYVAIISSMIFAFRTTPAGARILSLPGRCVPPFSINLHDDHGKNPYSSCSA